MVRQVGDGPLTCEKQKGMANMLTPTMLLARFMMGRMLDSPMVSSFQCCTQPFLPGTQYTQASHSSSFQVIIRFLGGKGHSIPRFESRAL